MIDLVDIVNHTRNQLRYHRQIYYMIREEQV